MTGSDSLAHVMFGFRIFLAEAPLKDSVEARAFCFLGRRWRRLLRLSGIVLSKSRSQVPRNFRVFVEQLSRSTSAKPYSNPPRDRQKLAGCC